MIIHVTDDVTTEAIKKVFAGYFPHLKIEFFKHPHEKNEGSSKGDLITEDLSFEELKTKSNKGDIEITPETKVSEIEQTFQEQYGINVQVFRKSGDIWLETTATDEWSIKKQNEIAEEMNKPIENEQ